MFYFTRNDGVTAWVEVYYNLVFPYSELVDLISQLIHLELTRVTSRLHVRHLTATNYTITIKLLLLQLLRPLLQLLLQHLLTLTNHTANTKLPTPWSVRATSCGSICCTINQTTTTTTTTTTMTTTTTTTTKHLLHILIQQLLHLILATLKYANKLLSSTHPSNNCPT